MHPIDYMSDQSQVIPPGTEITNEHENLIGNENLRRFLIDSARYLGLSMDQVDWLGLEASQKTTQ